MNSQKKILLSGVKPTGRPHIGNYFGAMKQFVNLQEQYECNIFIADLHALTSVQNSEQMQQNILDIVLDYVAIGIDPSKVTLFKQSDVPAHTELAWIFNCLTTMPYLMRAHAFKDAEAKNKEINVGVFDYPMLMAADILLYSADIVPVGQDQKQHVEIARDTAEKFNRIFGQGEKVTQIFKLPEELIMKEVATVPGIDGQKMSKSYDNTIPLFASDEEIHKLVMSIVTDSSGGEPVNVRAIHSLFRAPSDLDAMYKEKKGRYKELKEALALDLTAFITPFREKRAALEGDKDTLLRILKDGGEKARAKAEVKMGAVRQAVGIKLY